MGPSSQYVWQCGNLEIKVAHYMIVRDGLVCPKMHFLATRGGSGLEWHAQKIGSVPRFIE